MPSLQAELLGDEGIATRCAILSSCSRAGDDRIEARHKEVSGTPKQSPSLGAPPALSPMMPASGAPKEGEAALRRSTYPRIGNRNEKARRIMLSGIRHELVGNPA